jgi:KDO2-lipid IV(A) lauroyltransferase
MQIIEFIFVKLLYGIFRIVPYAFNRILCPLLRFIIQYIIRYRRVTIEQNLKNAFPDLSKQKTSLLVKEVYQNLTMLALEYLQSWRLNPSYFNENFSVHNWESLQEAREEGKGIILIAGHMGNFEWMGFFILQYIPQIYAIVKKIKNKKVNDFFVKTRERHGFKLLDKKIAFKNGLRALKANKIVAIVGDQDAKNKGVFVDFFGILSSTATGAALFHLQTGAPIVCCTSIRKEFGKFDLHFERLPDLPLQANKEQRIISITQAHTKVLEKWVKKYPGQYFWSHRRWKTKPTLAQINKVKIAKSFRDIYFEK